MPRLDVAARSTLPGSFVRLGRGFVHYELLGPEGGPLLVLVPGLSVPYSTWDRNASFLAAEGCRVLRYDHYGRGFSDRPRAVYDLDFHVGQLVELLPALGLRETALLVGLSMGGPVAAAAATKYPNLASGVVLVDPLFEWPRQASLARLSLLPLIGDAVMALRGPGMLVEGQRLDFLDPRAFEDFIPSYLPPLRYRGILRSVLSVMRSIPSWPLVGVFEGLGSSGIATLLLWGREDATLPLDQSSRLLALLPRATFRCIEGAGHVPHWEKPREVNGAILEFLPRRSVAPRPR
jgi:pimeloyl-ACP methyl ester carboxylesterase